MVNYKRLVHLTFNLPSTFPHPRSCINNIRWQGATEQGLWTALLLQFRSLMATGE